MGYKNADYKADSAKVVLIRPNSFLTELSVLQMILDK
jgi:hypothetical protein